MTKESKQDNIKLLKKLPVYVTGKAFYVRACTGFDGGFEVEEAIRRLRDCVPTWNLNINANNNRVALAA